MLRDHEVFRAPRTIPVDALVERPTPDAFRGKVTTDTIRVLPLALAEGGFPGWCSYVTRFGDSPEVEVLAGGVNHKDPTAAALWRQGHLLHFGFEEGAHELNPVGLDLLENAIVYIARFREDRPIAATPSVFVLGHSLPRRGALQKLLEEEGGDLDNVRTYLGSAELARSRELGRVGYAAHFAEHARFFGLDAEDKLELDPTLVALGVGNADPEFFGEAIGCLADTSAESTRRAAASAALARYAPCGPGADASAEQWRAWHAAHAPYLFFMEMGRYRWYVDDLAKARGISSRELRGPLRATH